MRKILRKKIWSQVTPLGYLGSLSWVQIVECFQNSMGLVPQGLEVTPTPVSALADFLLYGTALGVMCVQNVIHFVNGFFKTAIYNTVLTQGIFRNNSQDMMVAKRKRRYFWQQSFYETGFLSEIFLTLSFLREWDFSILVLQTTR